MELQSCKGRKGPVNPFSLLKFKKEIKCSGDSEIIIEIVRNPTRKSEKQEIVRVVSLTISCNISESQLHFISLLTLLG